jgi:hypothetical protein
MANRVVWTFLARDKFSAVAQRVKRKTDQMNVRFQRLNATMKKTAAGMKKMAVHMKKAAVAAGLAAGAALKAFSNMEKGIVKVYGLLNVQDLKKWSKTIDDTIANSMAEFGINSEEASTALYNAISVLGASEETFKTYNESIRLAVGGNADLAQATIGIGKLKNAYEGLTGAKAANILFVAQQLGGADVNQLAKNVGKVAKLAASMGISAEEYVATLGELTKFISPEEATTGIKGLTQALTGAKGEAKKILKEFGLPTTPQELIDTGWTESLYLMNKMIEENIDQAKLAIPNQEGLTAALAMTGKSAENVALSVQQMGSDQLTPSFLRNMETLDRKSKIAGQNMVLFAAEIGKELKPAIVLAAKVIGGLTRWFKSLGDASKKFVAGLVVAPIVIFVLVKAFMVLKTVFLALKVAFLFILPVLKLVFLAFKIIAWGVAAALSAIGWVPIAIAAAVVAVGLLIWKFDVVKQKIMETWGAVKNFFGFGGNEKELEVTGAADLTKTNKTEVDIGLIAPKNTVEYIRLRTSGDTSGLKTGVSMVTG